MLEGERYRAAYFADAQSIFSRAQHRFHKKTKKGYMPLPRVHVEGIQANANMFFRGRIKRL